jgi:1,4-alpha-glucan branching enzyme
MKRTPSHKSKSKTKKIEFKLYALEAQRVALAGDFNDWNVNTLPMKKDSEGNWRANIALPPGRYEYRLWVDGAWHDDPNSHEKVENPFGSQNCVRIVN